MALNAAADEKLAAARALLAAAEKELAGALAQLEVLARADKTMVDVAVRAALDTVTQARKNLDDVQRAPAP